MSSYWEEIKACAQGGATFAAAGGAVSGAAGSAAGGLYGCVTGSRLDEKVWSDVKRGVGAVWDVVAGPFDGKDEVPKQPISLEVALRRTAWHQHHRRRWSFEACLPAPSHKALRSGRCTWTAKAPDYVWHEANRRALYGEAGARTTPALLYKGLAVMYAQLRGTQPDPEALVLDAVRAYGDFLAARYPQGQTDEAHGAVEDWPPTARLRALQQLAEVERGQVLAVPQRPTSLGKPLMAGAGVLAVLAGAAVLVWRASA